MVSMEFLAQMGALVGTSAVLYYVTQPPPKNELLKQITASSSSPPLATTTNVNKNETTHNWNHQHAVVPLRGIQRYSSYHRIRYHNMISQSTTNSSNTAHNHNSNTNHVANDNNRNSPQKHA